MVHARATAVRADVPCSASRCRSPTVHLPEACIATNTSNVDTEDSRRAVEGVIERLAGRFPDQPVDRIAAVVEQELHGLEGTPIREFVPILVERQARERLGRLVRQ